MVLIHTRSTDDTTIEVTRWLLAYSKQFFRLNSATELEVVAELLRRDKNAAAYFGGLGLSYPNLNISDESLKTQVQEYLVAETTIALRNILNTSTLTSVIGNIPFSSAPDKLTQLSLANELGFTVPEYEIVFTKKRLLEIYNLWHQIVCKALGDGVMIYSKTYIIDGQRTEVITKEVIDRLGDHFPPVFIQRLVPKQFEVRTFYSQDIIKSVAIFSQSGPGAIDWRNRGTGHSARMVPFVLPVTIENMAGALLEQAGLNSGSFDFIVDPAGTFWFLEVNPYGQYGFVSKAGNYYIEKQIAACL